MSAVLETEVIIVGGGPVGMAAAADLNGHGIKTVVIEQRSFLQAPNVKCNHVSARTMERFRQLGMAQKVRDAGLPADHPQDVAFRVTMTGAEISRIPIPARSKRFTSNYGPDTGWATPEPAHRINQKYLEPIMMQHVAELENVTLLNELTYVDFVQGPEGVEAHATGNDGSEPLTIRGRFMIGADGGRSLVRKQISSKLSGDAILSNVQSTCIRAKGLYELMDGPGAWGYYTFNPRRNGHVYAIDGDELFLVHTYLSEEEVESGSLDRDWAIRSILGVDDSYEYEIVSEEDWVARRLVVDKFREKRVFIAGDASHLWIPYAGYGMNAGVADVLNLTWLLSAHLNGWADEAILDAYQTERLPITEQVSQFVKSHQRSIARTDVPANIEDDTVEAELAREKLGQEAYDLNVQQFAAEGLNFGYFYGSSPIISYDDELPPAFDMGTYTPSTVPGCRAPHFWLSDDVSLYDELGPAYTLVALGNARGIDPLLHAAVEAGMPLKVIVVNPRLVPTEYTRKYTVLRQDQHVAWRGDETPEDPARLIARLCGQLSA